MLIFSFYLILYLLLIWMNYQVEVLILSLYFDC
nr:MAG TPA: hypothetical protein [Caudoviricetes sp.]